MEVTVNVIGKKTKGVPKFFRFGEGATDIDTNKKGKARVLFLRFEEITTGCKEYKDDQQYWKSVNFGGIFPRI